MGWEVYSINIQDTINNTTTEFTDTSSKQLSEKDTIVEHDSVFSQAGVDSFKKEQPVVQKDSVQEDKEYKPAEKETAKAFNQVQKENQPSSTTQTYVPRTTFVEQKKKEPRDTVDSVKAEREESKTPVLLEGENKQTKTTREIKPIEKTKASHDGIFYSNDWVIGMVIITFVLLIFVRLFYNKYLQGVFSSIFNYKRSHRLYTNKNILTQQSFAILNLIFYLNIGLFLTEAADYFDLKLFDMHPAYLSLLISVLFLAAMVIKYVLTVIVGYIFNKKELFGEYLHNIFLFIKEAGLLLMPFVIVIPFIPHYLVGVIIKIALGGILFLLFMLIIRGLQIIIYKNVSFFYLILYLCVLEILPILYVIKIVNNPFGYYPI